jgi:hypothetical protein
VFLLNQVPLYPRKTCAVRLYRPQRDSHFSMGTQCSGKKSARVSQLLLDPFPWLIAAAGCELPSPPSPVTSHMRRSANTDLALEMSHPPTHAFRFEKSVGQDKATPGQDTASLLLCHFDSLLGPRHVTFFHTFHTIERPERQSSSAWLLLPPAASPLHHRKDGVNQRGNSAPAVAR